MGPINYITDVANPMQMALGGYEAALGQAQTRQGMELANTQEARAAETFAMEKKAYEEKRVAEALAKEKAIADRKRGDAAMMRLIDLGPKATTKDYLLAIAENPAYKESLGTVFEAFGADRQRGEVKFGTQLFSVLKTNPGVAKSMIEERRVAAEAAGDKETVDTMKSFELMLEQPGGADVLRATVGTTLAGVMGGQDFKATMDAIGVEESPDLFKNEKDIRAEYTKLTGDYRSVSQAYDRIVSAQNTGPGDIALIFNYMKMLDPGSTVREGEFATAQQSGGIPTAIVNMYNNAVNGERLTDEQRASFTSQAADLLGAAKKSEAAARESLMPVVNYYKLDPARVFGPSTESEAGAGADGAPTEAPAAIPEAFSSSQAVIDAAKKANVTVERMWQVMTPEQRANYGG